MPLSGFGSNSNEQNYSDGREDLHEELSDRLYNAGFTLLRSPEWYLAGMRTKNGLVTLYKGPDACEAYSRIIERMMYVLDLDFQLNDIPVEKIDKRRNLRESDFA